MTTIERLRALLAEADPPPWYWDKVMGGIRVADHYVVSSTGWNRRPNAEEALIAAAVNALPALLAVAEPARAIVDAYHAGKQISVEFIWALDRAFAALDAQEEATT